MVATGLYPLDSLRQVIAIVLGIFFVAGFAIYIGFKWSAYSERIAASVSDGKTKPD